MRVPFRAGFVNKSRKKVTMANVSLCKRCFHQSNGNKNSVLLCNCSTGRSFRGGSDLLSIRCKTAEGNDNG